MKTTLQRYTMKPGIIVMLAAAFIQNTMVLAQVPTSEEFYESAVRLYEQKSYLGAIGQLDLAILDSREQRYFKLRGDCFLETGRYESALADYNYALRKEVSDSTMFLNRAVCKINLEMFDDALMDIHKYLEKHPKSDKAFYYLAALEYLSWNYKGALDYLDIATSINDDMAEAHYLMGAVYGEQGKLDQALEHYGIAYEINPEFHRCMLNAAVLKLENGDAEAAADILEALKFESHDFGQELYYYLGEARLALHDKDGACSEWQTAAAIGDSESALNYDVVCLGAKGEKANKKQRLTRVTF